MTAPRIAMIASGGPGIGLGHVRRSAALGAALEEHGADVRFFLDGSGAVRELLEGLGFPVEPVTVTDGRIHTDALSNASAVIVDSYRIDAAGIASLRTHAPTLGVIDDLADRPLDADLIINTSPGAGPHLYAHTSHARLLLGLRYLLLRRELWDRAVFEVRDRIERVFVAVGGDDLRGALPRFVAAAREALPGAAIDAVAGPFSASELPRFDTSVAVHRNPPDLVSLMRSADTAISGAGQTAYELAALGVPTVAVSLFENQRPGIVPMAEAGILVYADWLAEDIHRALVGELRALDGDRDRRVALSRAAQHAVDGQGARRAASALMALIAERERA